MDYEKKYKEALERIKDNEPDENGIIHIRPFEIFPELAESEDEMTRKEILNYIKHIEAQTIPEKQYDSWIAWLEKQGEHANFINKIQIGDKVTRNEDGVLVNLSQLERIAKPNESKQGEQKPVEWSEEDEKIKDNLISELSNLATRRLIKNETYSKYSSWLKSLRPQNTWKPSDEQIEALETYIYQPQYAESKPIEGSDMRVVDIVEVLYKELKAL